MQTATPQIANLLNLELLRKELAERSFYEFVKMAWHVVEPGVPFRDGRHIQIICEALEATLDGKAHNIVFNIPPRCMKSLLVCVFFPCWCWITRPHIKFLTASYNGDLATRDAVKSRRLIESGWYQQRWGDRFQLAADQNQKQKYENTEGGHRIICSPSSTTTGLGGDYLLVDDPIGVTNAYSSDSRESCITWWDEAMFNRLNDPSTGSRIIIGQRVHVDDLSGHCLANKGTIFEHIILPMEYEPSNACALDWRTEEGELLWPERFPAEVIQPYKSNSRLYAGQYQQRPSPPGGVIIRTDWLKFYTTLPDTGFDTLIQSWDLNLTGGKGNDYVVGQLWGRIGSQCYLVDQVMGQWDFPETITQMRAFSAKHPTALSKLVENKANGAAAIATLSSELAGLIPVNPGRDNKEQRLLATAPLWESGCVLLPLNAPFTSDFVAEITAFPSVPHDDRTDACSQALNRLSQPQRKYAVDFI